MHFLLFITHFPLVLWQCEKCISGKRNIISWHCGLSRFPIHWTDKWSQYNVLLKASFQLLLYFVVISSTGNSPSLVLTIKSSFQLGCCTCYTFLNAVLFWSCIPLFACKNIVRLCNSEAVIYFTASDIMVLWHRKDCNDKMLCKFLKWGGSGNVKCKVIVRTI